MYHPSPTQHISYYWNNFKYTTPRDTRHMVWNSYDYNSSMMFNDQITLPTPTSLLFIYQINKQLTNIEQYDMNLSLLALPCPRIPLEKDGVYCLPCRGWALDFLPTYHFYFLFYWFGQVERRSHIMNHTANHSIRKWVHLHYHLIV